MHWWPWEDCHVRCCSWVHKVLLLLYALLWFIPKHRLNFGFGNQIIIFLIFSWKKAILFAVRNEILDHCFAVFRIFVFSVVNFWHCSAMIIFLAVWLRAAGASVQSPSVPSIPKRMSLGDKWSHSYGKWDNSQHVLLSTLIKKTIMHSIQTFSTIFEVIKARKPIYI